MASGNNSRKINNVTRLHYMPRFNVGLLLLLIIFIYLVVSFIMYLTKDKVLTYEVNAGQLVSENTFSGVIIYDEAIVNSPVAGYVKYFLNDNERAGVNTLICIVDETNSIASKLTTSSMDNGISSATINNIGRQLTNYAKEYEPLKFYQSYKVLDKITSTVTEYNAEYMVDSLNELLTDNDNFVHLINPDTSTMVSFYSDSLCGITEDMVSASTFDMENYAITNLKNRELVGAGDALYRTVMSDKWKVVFPLTENQVSQYSNVTSVTVNFLAQDITTTAGFSIIYNSDGSYGMLSLDRYLVNFMDTRFVDFEISQNAASGLKIPISSVCEKEFYTIPVEYGCLSDDNEKDTGFLLLSYDNAGNQTRRFVDATYYANKDGYYYVNKDVFNIGDCIVMPPGDDGSISFGDEMYIVGTVATLKGAYCVNKGYCQFRQVSIIDRNSEYYIIERGTAYGLSIYDYIILNAEMVTENQIIY